MYVCSSLCVCLVPAEARRGHRNSELSELQVIDSCELSCGFWELNLVSLQEQQVLLTNEISPAPRLKSIPAGLFPPTFIKHQVYHHSCSKVLGTPFPQGTRSLVSGDREGQFQNETQQSQSSACCTKGGLGAHHCVHFPFAGNSELIRVRCLMEEFHPV